MQTCTVNGVTTQFIWDGANIVAEITDNVVTTYSRGLRLISTKTGTTKYYYHPNPHGDVTKLTNASGAVVESYTYDAFGNVTAANNLDNPFRYAGEYYDIEIGLIYLRMRWYDPSLGRFISEDPIRAGFNWYAYCHNDPVNFIDPSGLADILLRKFVEDRGGSVDPVPLFYFLGSPVGLKYITVNLNGIPQTFYKGDSIDQYRINNADRSLMDDGFLLNTFYGDTGNPTDKNPSKQQIQNYIMHWAYFNNIPWELAMNVAFTESGYRQVQSNTGRVDNGGGDWGIFQINNINLPEYEGLYGDVKGNWHNNVKAGVHHIWKSYNAAYTKGFSNDLYKATYSAYNGGQPDVYVNPNYSHHNAVKSNVDRFWNCYVNGSWR